ncbi:hypothetical protein [Marimonas arenosa]|uniref:Uncharacterized protein n=1 Tax=Marimonas arenosa TaxID=1795305 RepID=A0AAE3W9C2_9RHOB|nr:hypothetical protein [Marimonas arenosa]MDQ2088283.1 hypothetical protein [Marimonas arenosa]
MFETIPTGIRTSKAHGGFVLLESFRFEAGDVTVRVFAPGSGDAGELRFSDVIGFTMKEDVFGSDGGQITREDVEPQTDRTGRPGFFQRASASPTMRAIRAAVPPPFGDSVEEHQHYRLHLREHELSFVAGPDYEIKVEAKAPAN